RESNRSTLGSFFKMEIMHLSCEDKGWMVKRNTSLSAQSSCEAWGGWEAPNCAIDHLPPQYDTGVYWCESSEGQTSPSLYITVTDGPVLLQSPVLPVPEGQNIALTCQHRTSSKLPARFYHDGRLLSTQPSGHMTITHVSASHGGLYSCEIRGDRSESNKLKDCLGTALHVEPERLQFFKMEIMHLSCEDKGWMVKRNTSLSAQRSCEACGGWEAPNCAINHLSPQYDTGVYWCESSAGQTSPSLYITVTDRPVLLQSPVLPVPEGQNIALTCQHRTSSNLPARFYHDGRLLLTQPSGHMTITHVSASHGGLYSCEIRGDRSESSHIHVTGQQFSSV
uniref:Ig-like domain-containing protein n=1 Tax=Neogobius melanostomus TaxID=47308 RepID=A0A8C6UFZ9_9GOBI